MNPGSSSHEDALPYKDAQINTLLLMPDPEPNKGAIILQAVDLLTFFHKGTIFVSFQEQQEARVVFFLRDILLNLRSYKITFLGKITGSEIAYNVYTVYTVYAPN